MEINQLKTLACRKIEEHAPFIENIARQILSHPEVGFQEYKTSSLVSATLTDMGIPVKTNLAITGVKGKLSGEHEGPTISILSELDALVVHDHPNADPVTNSAHACGHNCQIAMMIGCMIGLNKEPILKNLYGSIVPFAVPAEEFINIPDRLALKRQGQITFLGGKQELISLGHFDDIDIAFMCHTASGSNEKVFAVGGSSTTHVTKIVTFSDLSESTTDSTQNAASFAIQALNYNRDLFKGEDTPRSHGILIQPAENHTKQSQLEWRIRASDLAALENYSRITDQCFRAAALATGCEVTIETTPGYLPMINDTKLQSIFVSNSSKLLGNNRVITLNPSEKSGGSTDMGDLSHVIPVCHPYCTGASGTGHSNDYIIKNYNTAVINPTKIMSMVAIDLLSQQAEGARQIIDQFKQRLNRQQYTELQLGRFSTSHYA